MTPPLKFYEWGKSGLWLPIGGGAPMSGQVLGPRDSLVYGISNYTPVVGTNANGGTAGLADDTILTAVNGDFTVTDGDTYSNLDIKGRLIDAHTTSQAPTFKNCRVRTDGTSFTSGVGCVTTSSHYGNDFRGTSFYDCDFGTSVPSPWLAGIVGGGFNLYRCYIHDVVDGIDPTINSASPTNILGNVIQKPSYFKWDTSTGAFIMGPEGYNSAIFPAYGDGHASGDNHCDAIQFGYGTNILVRGNVLGGVRSTTSNPNDGLAFPNSSIIYTLAGTSLALSGVTVDDNYLQGGAAEFNYNSAYSDTGTTLKVTNNVFFPQYPATAYEGYASAAFAGTWTNNLHPDGTTASLVTH